MRLFGRKDQELFALFRESARMVIRGGDILRTVVNDYTDLDVKMEMCIRDRGAVFADTGVALLAVFNSMRIIKSNNI